MLALAAVPIAALFPLLVLAVTFEAVFALHIGVERIGRYLQVAHEDAWEQTAMAFGAPLAGTGSDPLFVAMFGLATSANLLPVLVAQPTQLETLVIGACHAALLVRIAFARRAAGRQRTADLERFRQIKRGTNSQDR